MKKVLRKVLVSVLCFSVIFSYSFYAFADDGVDNDVTDSTPVATEDISTDASDADISSEETGEIPSISEDDGLGDSEGTEEGTEEDAVTDEDTADSNQEAIPEEEPQTLTATADDGANVTIEADAGVLPEGATVKANAIGFFGKLGMKSAIKEAVEENDAELVEFKAYDITIYSGDEAVQPNGKVSVSITGTGLESEGNVYHVSDDNSVAEPVEGSASADEAEFTTDHFSIYVVTDENSPALATYIFKNDDKVVSTQIVKNGESLVAPEVPEKDGYKFVGWFNGEKEFTSFGNVSVTKTENVTLTARFAEAHYVYFMDRNGQSVAVTKEGVEGDSITTSDVVLGNIGADEAVTGWYYDKELTKPVESITIGTENIKVYPKVEKGHWITFETDGGTYIAPVFYANGVNTVAPAVPERIGYTFDEWIDKSNKTFTFGSTLNGNIELLAKWTPANTNYTVIYWHENADDDNYSYKESVSKTGLTGSIASYDEKSYKGFTFERADDLEIAGDGSTIVNVYYSRNEYTVTWGDETKTLVCGKEEHRHNDYSCYETKLTCTNEWHSILPFLHDDSCFAKILKCTKEEHRHSESCYKYDAKYKVTAKHGAYIGDKWPGGSWQVKESTHYQAYLETMPIGGMSFTQKSNKDGTSTATYYVESLDDSNKYVVHHTDTIDGTNWTVTQEDKYALIGFTYTYGPENGDRYNGANFYYSRNSYSLVFMNNGKKDKEESVKYQADISNKGYTPEKPNGVPEGYVFAGWYDNEFGEGTQYDFTGKTMPAKAITLYAKWTAPAYTVTAHVSSGDVSIPVGYGQKIDQTKLPDYSEEENFSGWATKDGKGNYVIFNLDTRIFADTDIYPIFVAAGKSYTVTYKMNADSTDTSEISVDGNLYLADSKAAIKQNMFSVDGKVFLGWTGSDGNTYQPGDKITVTGNMTLTAIWGDEPETVSVTYNANGGTGTDVVVTGLANNSLVENKTATQCGFSKAGYTFAGWGKTADATVDIFANDAKVRVDSNGSNTLYAIWKANENTAYTVEYYYQKDGAYPATTEKSVSKTGTTGATVNVTDAEKTPTEAGYVFDEKAPNVLSGKVAGDGSLVLKVYFKQQFTVDSIYIYVQVQGLFDKDISTKYGLTQLANPTGHNWYVIGVSSYAVEQKAADLPLQDKVKLSDDDRNKILGSISPRYNTDFKVSSDKIAWNNFLKVEDGAGSISSDNPFVYNGTNAYHLDGVLTLTNYTVKYVDEDTHEEIADSETVNNVAVPETISAAAYASKSIDGYVQTSTSDDLSLTVENATGTDSNREIIIYYSEDVLSDPDEDKDPEKQGDGIPDKYQDTVTYKVVNGAWNDESTSDVSEVVTFKLDGVPSNNANATAQLSHVPGYGDKPAAGYIKSGSWTPRTPETVQKAEDVREFTYTYIREEVVPVDPIVPPFTPESVYTVTYMDGVDDEVVFEDQSTTNLKKGDKTPAFNGEPVREGYKFIGWSPVVAETVTGDAVYYAQWEKLPEEPAVVDPSGDNDPIDDGKDIDAQPNGDADTEAKGVKTGDETMLAMWGALGLLAALGLGGTLVIGRRREE